MLTEVVVELEDEIGALADLGELLGGQGGEHPRLGGGARGRGTGPRPPGGGAGRRGRPMSCASTAWCPSGSARCCR
jgi:hypothetical protein